MCAGIWTPLPEGMLILQGVSKLVYKLIFSNTLLPFPYPVRSGYHFKCRLRICLGIVFFLKQVVSRIDTMPVRQFHFTFIYYCISCSFDYTALDWSVNYTEKVHDFLSPVSLWKCYLHIFKEL